MPTPTGIRSAIDAGRTACHRWRFLLLIAATLAVAALSIRKTAGNVLARRAPDIARRLDSGNALALAAAADRLFAADPARNAPTASQLAQSALYHQGINAYALRIMGYAADVERQPTRAAALIGLSTRMSRRDSPAQIWLIEKSVSAGDVPAALRHYDIALRTSRLTANLLYPILTGALDEEAVRTAFAPYVRRRPLWMEAFLAYAIAHSAHPERIATMLLGVDGALADSRNGEINARLVERLIAVGRAGEAKQVYLATPGWPPARLVSAALDLADRTARDGALGWRLTSTPVGQAIIDAGPGNTPVLHVEMTGGNSDRVAEKILFQPPGRYRFAARAGQASLGENGLLRWRLACLAGDVRREIWMQESRGGSLTAYITIPADCGMQSLTLEVAVAEGVQDASTDIMHIAIKHD